MNPEIESIIGLRCDADREVPTRSLTDTAGNEVYRDSGIIRWPEGWDLSICIGDR